MRITNNMLSRNYLRNLNKNLKVMQKYQEQLSTGKEISKPSDNPMMASKIMSLQSTISANEQYSKNIEDSIGWVNVADTAISDVIDSVQRLREIVVHGANDALSDTDKSALADEASSLSGQIQQALNTNYDGRYIFGGLETLAPPFTDSLEYKGDESLIKREIARGIQVNLPNNGKAFTYTDNTSSENKELGGLIANIEKALRAENSEELSSKLLSDVDAHLDNLIRGRSRIGSLQNRLDSSKEMNESENLAMKTTLSQVEDIDLAQKVMEYSMAKTVYEASLQTGAKMLQQSLLDYLK